MPGKVLKTANWLIDLPELTVGPGKSATNSTNSTEFTLDYGQDVTNWILQVRFNYLFPNNSSKFFVLRLASKNSRVSFDMHCSLAILSQTGTPDLLFTQFNQLSADWDRGLHKGDPMILLQNKLYEDGCPYVKDGKIHVVVVIRELKLPESGLNKSCTNEISKKMANYFDKITYSDSADLVLLQTSDGTVLKTHKKILSNSSIVFQRMFETDMAEKDKNVVNIIDFSGKVMEEFLKFISIGTANLKNVTVGIELYEVAKVYQVDLLLRLCAIAIESKIDIENVFEIVNFAAVHDEKESFATCCDIIGSYFPGPDELRKKIEVLSIEIQNRVLLYLNTKFRSGSIFTKVETCKN